MEQNSSINTIELQGIVRNTTKLAQQDGQTDELINLRLKDGSWQPTGEGKQVFTLPDGWEFNQMYIHTNVYRHLLGVSNSTLYWIANIDADGVFYTGDSSEPDNENKTAAVALFRSSGEYQPIEICRVQGKVDIMQTGHLITIIDESERFDYFVFKRDDYAGTQEYRKVVIDVNDDSSNRELYPFGRINFNYITPHFEYNELIGIPKGIDFYTNDLQIVSDGKIFARALPIDNFLENGKNIISTLYSEVENKNLFTRPFLVCAAIKLYDGTYIYASQPTLIYPRQLLTDGKIYFRQDYNTGKIELLDFKEWQQDNINGYQHYNLEPNDDFVSIHYGHANGLRSIVISNRFSNKIGLSSLIPSIYTTDIFPNLLYATESSSVSTRGGLAILFGNQLTCTIANPQIIKENKDIFSSLCIFVTPEVQDHIFKTTDIPSSINTQMDIFSRYKEKEDIIYEIIHQPFYLLREYKISELTENSFIVNLSGIEYDGILKSINQGTATELLTYEAINRKSYSPKISFLYNGRVHIANYNSKQYSGYAIDNYLYDNLAVKKSQVGTIDNVLFGIERDNVEIPDVIDGAITGTPYLKVDYPRTKYPFIENAGLGYWQQSLDAMIANNKPFAYIKTTIETDSGTQIVVRYIPAYNATLQQDGRIDIIQSLNPLVTFPDSRAKQMDIYVVNIGEYGQLKIYRKSLQLTAHLYMNFAYYMSPDLKPIDLEYDTYYQSEDVQYLDDVPQEANTSEHVPNGMKVSKVNNPMYFPVESTYQIGSSEIVALASNAKAVGTGQTGQAPLYTFTKDGVYGLFVDSSGQVAYNTARILTRDVCNNAKSVTPIDAGVAFTTDRGLMLMQGEEAKELSQPAEGEPNKFSDTTDAVEYCKIAANSLQLDQLAGLAGQQTQENLLDYLKGCIINYNHNERELMISNPDKSYTYILDRNSNWSKRDYTADEYVNNFPTSYRVKDGVFYKVDEESNADNGVYILTRPIKLGTIAYKQAFRCVVRGVFELLDDTKALGMYVFGSYDGRKWALLGGKEKQGGMFTDIGCKIERTDVKFLRLCLAGQIKQKSRLDFIEITAESKLYEKLR